MADRPDREGRYEAAAANIRDILLFVRLGDGRILETNEAAVRTYGYSREEVLELTISDLRAPGSRAEVPSQLAQAAEHGILFQTVHQRRDGTTFPVEVSSRGAVIDGTRVLISVVRDITERLESEEALRKIQRRYRALVEMSPDAVFVNRQGRVAYVNPAAVQLFGAGDASDVLGRSVYDLFRPEFHETMNRRIDAVLSGRTVPRVETGIVRLDGKECAVEAAASLFEDAEGPALQVILHDITKRKEAEEQLRQLNETL